MASKCNDLQSWANINAGVYTAFTTQIPVAFMISEDKRLDVATGAGEKRSYPAGTFNTGVRYDVAIQRVMEGTEIGIHAIWFFYE